MFGSISAFVETVIWRFFVAPGAAWSLINGVNWVCRVWQKHPTFPTKTKYCLSLVCNNVDTFTYRYICDRSISADNIGKLIYWLDSNNNAVVPLFLIYSVKKVHFLQSGNLWFHVINIKIWCVTIHCLIQWETCGVAAQKRQRCWAKLFFSMQWCALSPHWEQLKKDAGAYKTNVWTQALSLCTHTQAT